MRTIAVVNEVKNLGSDVMSRLDAQASQIDIERAMATTTPTTNQPQTGSVLLTPQTVAGSAGEERPAKEEEDTGFASDEEKDEPVVPWTERSDAELRLMLSPELFETLQLKKQKMEEEKRKKEKEKPEIDNVFADMVLPFARITI
jgi:hypothetical protein